MLPERRPPGVHGALERETVESERAWVRLP
jgi:hypothetical protein